MSDLGPHASYIIASYIAAAIILGFTVVFSLIANRNATRRLAEIEAREALAREAAR